MQVKKLTALFGVSALALLLTATPVLAAEVDVEATNEMTGADSDNDNDFDIDNDLDLDVDNDGDVVNTATADVETGNNEQDRNTEAGDLETGSVDASTDWESVVNDAAMLAGDDDGLEVTGDFTNDTTGADSDNDNDLDVDHDVDLVLDNIADIVNVLGLTANTGENEQTRNTTAGDIDTGDVEVDSVISNWANNDSGFASASHGTTSVDVTGENNTTGADSDNDNDFDIDNDLDIDVDNDADITNSVTVDATTGGNEQRRNTVGGDISTGDIEVSTDITNEANNGSSSLMDGGSSLDVSGDFTNDTTGADSDNDNDLDVDHDVDLTVDNIADVTNVLDVDANSGENEQSRNTTGGNIDTGSVSVDFGSSTTVNSN